MKDEWEQRVCESVGVDDYGTIRVCEKFGSIAIYIKTGDNEWTTVYVDPERGVSVSPYKPVSDHVAGMGRVVYSPKTVVSHDE